jgi:hypothetical protein
LFNVQTLRKGKLMKKILLSLAALSCVLSAQAVVLASDNFDSLAIGDLSGQGGWDSFSNLTYDVTAGAGIGGTQAAVFNRIGTSTQYAWKNFTYDSAATSNKTVIGSVKMFVGSTPQGGTFNRGGLSGWANDGANLIGGARLRSDGTIFNFATGAPVGTLDASRLNTWIDFALAFNFASQTIDVSVNNSLVGTMNFSSLQTTMTDVDLTSGASSGSLAAGTVKYDDYMVQAVPEPATMTALALGLAAIARRRKSA